ncbi:putative iron-regulated protein [Variovorax paradoxus]|uniref:ChaN family lipoprotein n=1 Tax=Variovorax paradoxus TaxID=34073 RepID=UPI00278B7253|nr:ChaN family lipoprotein [Variovorax paradoxus]MDP9931525.1 putative iron-regulated protein [Variovorax paradoxus]MDQ0025137.1 putative iron-regulated protein [Variovorax paradoxus]
MHCPPSPARATRLPLPVFAVVAAAIALAGCTAFFNGPNAPVARRAAALLPTDALIIGEQHDAPEHHAIERETVEALASKGKLAALLLEMAEEGHSTARLDTAATDAQAQAALGWNDKAWPWDSYGPVVMAAVRAGVPVIGANLPRARMKNAMTDVSLDVQLNGEAYTAQQDAVREGHCKLLPEPQIVPMTRIQVGRDRAMAQAIVKARQPGKTVLLISGAGHATKVLGVPQHLPTDVSVKAVRLQAGESPEENENNKGAYDAVWRTPPLPPKDYCAGMRTG